MKEKFNRDSSTATTTQNRTENKKPEQNKKELFLTAIIKPSPAHDGGLGPRVDGVSVCCRRVPVAIELGDLALGVEIKLT